MPVARCEDDMHVLAVGSVFMDLIRAKARVVGSEDLVSINSPGQVTGARGWFKVGGRYSDITIWDGASS